MSESESLHFGHHLLRLMVEDQTERRQIVRELCSAVNDDGKVSTQDVEGILTQHGVEFVNKKCLDDVRDFINSI